MTRLSVFFTALTTALILTVSWSAQAYFETAESGEIQKKGDYRAGLIPQVRLSDGSGMNFTGFLDSALNESSSLRLLIGGGQTDFYTGGSYKWIPIPDYDKQPAIGAKLEVIYARLSADSAVSLRLHPMASKRFEIDQGTLIPYIAVPFGTYTYQNTTEVPVNLVTGTEFMSPETDNMQFGVELGLNANKSFSYISAFATLLLDDTSGHKRRK